MLSSFHEICLHTSSLNPRKILGSANHIFLGSPPRKKGMCLYHKSDKNSGGHPEKIQVLKPRFFQVGKMEKSVFAD